MILAIIVSVLLGAIGALSGAAAKYYFDVSQGTSIVLSAFAALLAAIVIEGNYVYSGDMYQIVVAVLFGYLAGMVTARVIGRNG